MPKDFQLQLNTPPNGTYLHGSKVSGTLLLTTNEVKEYKAIQVSLTGFSHVHWSKSTGTGQHGHIGTGQHMHGCTGEHMHTVHYNSREDYLNLVAVVWDKNQHGSGGKLPPGSYQWPFAFTLQTPNLPPSYEGTVGRIRYTIAARIVKDALLKFDTKAEAILTIGNVVPVDRPDLLQPQALSVEKTLCCLCCASAPIRITASIPRTGYCIQQDAISLEVEIENGSNREVRNLTAIIRQIVLYTAQGGRRYSNKTIANVPPSEPIPPRSTQVWKPTPLQVPVTETSITTCSNISLSYVLEVSASISGAINPKMDFPILLGNVPLPGASVPPPSGAQPLTGVPPPPGSVLPTPGFDYPGLQPAGVLPPTGAPPPTGGVLPAPGPGYTGPLPLQATANPGYPTPAYTPYPATNPVSGGQQLGFAAPFQPTVMESKPPPQSAQLPLGFVDPIKRS